METSACEPALSLTRVQEGELQVRLSGEWTIQVDLPSPEKVRAEVASGGLVRRITFDSHGLSDWDSSLLTFLVKVNGLCTEKGIEMDFAGLPHGGRRLLKLATAVPERE